MPETLALYDSILNASPLPQLVIEADERIAAANGAARQLLGTAIVSRHYITGLRQPGLLDCIETVLSGRANSAEAPFYATEATRETSYRVVATAFNSGDARDVLLTFIDTTDLEEAGQMRRDFVANVSHELRTPLTALAGFIETLQGPARDDAAARERFLGIMAREAERMNRLVRDLLSLSRVESEERLRPQESVDLCAVVSSGVAALDGKARELGVELRLSGCETPAMVPGDADQLGQVALNLMENAIKYGQSGGKVTVSVNRQGQHPAIRGPAVLLSVADRGEGIDPVHIPRLTERFYRIDDHRSREMGGTGLGLAIVKHIVSRHRGRLRIESDPGKGSVFTVILPAE